MIGERVAHALHSGNLAMKNTGIGDADVLVAMGWIGRKSPLGAAMLRAQLSGEQFDTAVAESIAYERLQRHRAMCRKGDDYWRKVAATAVKHWRNPACGHCDGLKYELIPGSPTLSATPCRHCDGTGIARYPKVAGESLGKAPWRNIINGVITYLEQQQQHAETLIRKVLTNNGNTS